MSTNIRICQCVGLSFCLKRQFSASQICSKSSKSHYDTLGVRPDATLAEIKKAYYNLTMIYHPDKNTGNEEAIAKFRQITEAYEVISSVKKKRLYDKGVPHGSETETPESRMKKSRYMPGTGKKPVYNFDEWTRAHYGKTFEKRNMRKEQFDIMEKSKEYDIHMRPTEIFFYSFLAFFLVVIAINYIQPRNDK